MRHLFICAACVGAAACTTDLDVRKLQPDQPRVGVGYVLPFTQYKVTTTWRVAECTGGDDGGDRGIKIATKVELAEGQADDADHAYLIDPTQLQSFLSISAFQMKFVDGANQLSTINVSSEDHSAQAIGKVAAGVGKLALALAAPGQEPGAAAPPTACTPKIAAAVLKSKDQQAALDVATGKVKAAQARLQAANDKIAAMGANTTDDARKELGDAIDAVNTALKDQAKATSALAETLDGVTVVRISYWPQDSRTFATTTPIALPDATLDKWASLKEAERSKVLRETQVHLAIVRAGSFGLDPAQVGTAAYREPATLPPDVPRPARPTFTDRPDEEGLRYRMPVKGRVFACASSPCGEASTDAYARLDGMVDQLGYVNVLPVRTRRFGSTTFAAEFAANGQIKSAGYEEKVAAGENAAGAFGDVVAATTPLIDYQKGKTARAEAAELAELDYLKKKRDALAALQDDPNADTAASAKALDADTALLNARIANLNAQLTLAETQAKASGTAP